LNWEIIETPEWGEWNINPGSGTNLAKDDCIIVSVSVTVPDEENSEFAGNIKIMNIENENDYCEVPVSLITPKNKVIQNDFYLLNWLFEHFHLIFQILR
jgi:hypothetical protein